MSIGLSALIIDSACRQAAKLGHKIGNYSDTGNQSVEEFFEENPCEEMCPLQAVALVMKLDSASEAANELDLAWFEEGYDNDPPQTRTVANDPGFLLGKRFRTFVNAGVYG